eukprot:1789240-Alexandrium_andersonii.AAC.1
MEAQTHEAGGGMLETSWPDDMDGTLATHLLDLGWACRDIYTYGAYTSCALPGCTLEYGDKR